MRHAIVVGGLVANVIEWDGKTAFEPPAGAELHRLEDSAAVNPGDKFSGKAKPVPHILPPPAPERVEEKAPQHVIASGEDIEAIIKTRESRAPEDNKRREEWQKLHAERLALDARRKAARAERRRVLAVRRGEALTDTDDLADFDAGPAVGVVKG